MSYMLDTNICIYVMKAHPPEVLARLTQLGQDEAVMSIVTYAELRAGLEMVTDTRFQNESALNLLIKRIPIQHFDEAAAESFGRLRAAVRDRRRDALDRLIAAHAISLDATLITNNETDFKDYPGLKVENWVNPPL
ncbi:MAG: type II toxin-antitoxin system VapC family toxin [Pseudomonadota bacterium]|nr:type II toxin-antitoxin system VapC family toxin [Pseudomonadota bacterium]MDP1903083.1 type II toxin-antitoxin system VapC family toxin [Pseudomonadota bacterium]MDP2353073.1 type II toxin-antitoxin system VapC family toxin [Pseudomonadota bacterium]